MVRQCWGKVKKLLDARACQSLKRIPADLKVETMVFADCPALEELPWGLQAVMLDVGGCTALKTLPADLKIRYGKLMMRGCTGLISIPNGIDSLELLDVTGCTALLRLPDELEVTTLVATNCTALTELPPKLFIAKGIGHDGGGYDGGKLMLRGCTALKALPASLRRIDFLDISNCPKVTEIPVTLKVKRIELAGSGLRSIPPHLDDVELRWRGVRVTKDIAFHPETITDAAIEATTDDALKRIMLERRSATRH